MEHKFYQGKRSIKRKDSFQKFKQKVSGLTERSYLSLLLKDAIEHSLQPFNKFLTYLLEQGADINFTQPKKKTTLLMLACKSTHLNIVEMLLEHKQINLFEKDRESKNAVHYAFLNQSQEDSWEIVMHLFERYPKFKELGYFQNGNYFTLALDCYRMDLLKLLIQEQIELDFLKNEGSVLHQVMTLHANHKDYQKTLSFLKLFISAGCRQDFLNERQENFIHFAINEGIMKEEEISEMMKQLKPQSFKKQLTLQTSPEDKCPDSFQEEEFSENQSFNEGDFDVFSHTSNLYEPKHEEISEQMYKITVQIHQNHQKTWATLYPFYLKLYQIVAQLYGTIEVIGSFASNLWIPNCDIDFLLIIPQPNSNLFDQIVQNIYYKVKNLGCHYHIKFFLGYKLPMIKIILSKQFDSLEVELFLSSRKNIATQYVAFIQNIMTYYPQIQIIYLVIRKMLEVKSLHDHKHGGLKAYGLFLLIYSMRSQYQYSHVSQFLEHFAYYYGIAYDYVGELTDGEVTFKINIIDPLNSENNMGGKKTDILSLQELFKKIYYGINMENQGGKIAYIMDLIRQI